MAALATPSVNRDPIRMDLINVLMRGVRIGACHDHHAKLAAASYKIAKKFHETFHDNGPTNMLRMLEIYSKAEFNGLIRPNHAPTIEINRNDTRSGYTMGGKVFAFGLMKGIMEALKLPYP